MQANKLLYGAGQLKAQIVGGPNRREDFHINEGEELFYMIKGDMQLNIMECGMKREIPIKEGEIFVLSGRIPHSPQRFENTIGLVIERERKEGETDGLRWYVPETDTILFQDWFHCTDLGTQLKPIIDAFFASEEYKSKVPTKSYPLPHPVQLDTVTRPPAPVLLANVAPKMEDEGKVIYDSEFQVVMATEKSSQSTFKTVVGEVFLWQFEGEGEVDVCVKGKEGVTRTFKLPKGAVFLVPSGFSYKAKVCYIDTVLEGMRIYLIWKLLTCPLHYTLLYYSFLLTLCV
jgi:3-hydroxyanthranilate 3,4-dioxygenase